MLDFDENSTLFAVYDGHGGKIHPKICGVSPPGLYLFHLMKDSRRLSLGSGS